MGTISQGLLRLAGGHVLGGRGGPMSKGQVLRCDGGIGVGFRVFRVHWVSGTS